MTKDTVVNLAYLVLSFLYEHRNLTKIIYSLLFAQLRAQSVAIFFCVSDRKFCCLFIILYIDFLFLYCLYPVNCSKYEYNKKT